MVISCISMHISNKVGYLRTLKRMCNIIERIAKGKSNGLESSSLMSFLDICEQKMLHMAFECQYLGKTNQKQRMA